MRKKLSIAAAIAVSVLIATFGCASSGDATPLRDAYRQVLFEGRNRVALKPETLKSEVRDGKRVERVAFQSEPGERVIAAIVRPETASGRLPAVIVQHWLGGTKDEFILQALMWQFATRGFLAIAIDGRHRGERAKAGTSFQAALTETLRTGKGRPWLLDTVYDIVRTVDYLEVRDDVDRRRIGMTGFSEGGIVTWLAAAADERIRIAVPVVGVTRFRDITANLSTEAGQARINLIRPVLETFAKQEGATKIDEALMRKAWDRFLPGFHDRFEADQLMPLIAPRPLLMLCHEKDDLIPVAGAKVVHAAALERYRTLKAEDRLSLRIAPGLTHTGQDMTEIAALFGWFEKWLKQ